MDSRIDCLPNASNYYIPRPHPFTPFLLMWNISLGYTVRHPFEPCMVLWNVMLFHLGRCSEKWHSALLAQGEKEMKLMGHLFVFQLFHLKIKEKRKSASTFIMLATIIYVFLRGRSFISLELLTIASCDSSIILLSLLLW